MQSITQIATTEHTAVISLAKQNIAYTYTPTHDALACKYPKGSIGHSYILERCRTIANALTEINRLQSIV